MQSQKVALLGSRDEPLTRSQSTVSSLDSTTISVLQRPSSPRQFFERLYGHLETRSSESGDIDVGTHAQGHGHSHKPPPCDTPYHSDGGSVSSPDISISDDRGTLPGFTAYDFYSHSKDYSQHQKLSYVNPPPMINQGVPNAVLQHGFPPGFPGDPHFSAGFSAFRK